MSSPRKEPRFIKKVYEEMFAHPYYPQFSQSTRWALEVAGASGYSWCKKANDKWARQFWRWLYVGGPKPAGMSELPEHPTSNTQEIAINE